MNKKTGKNRPPPQRDQTDVWAPANKRNAKAVNDLDRPASNGSRASCLLANDPKVKNCVALHTFEGLDLDQITSIAPRQDYSAVQGQELLEYGLAAVKIAKLGVRLGIDWMTVEYARSKAEEDRRARRKASDPLHRLNVIREEIEENEKLEAESKARILQVLELAQADWKSYEEDQISELSMIRVLASVGTMVVVFDHELRASIDALRGIHSDLADLKSSLPASTRSKYLETINQLAEWVKSIEQQGAQVGLLLSREARQRKRRFALREEVSKMVAPFSRYMMELGIEFKNEVPGELRTPEMFECELQSILLNLQTNALKAVRSVRKRAIGVIGARNGASVKIAFVDTGVGIPESDREEIFRPFVTTSEPDAVLGVGTGLGLKIVKDLIEVYGGTIRVGEAPIGWKTALEIDLPLLNS